VWATLTRLKKSQRETVILHYLSGYTQQEVAAMLDVPVGTVKYRLHEARARFKKVTLAQVKDIMKRQTLSENFTDKVLDILCSYPARGRMPNPNSRDALIQIGVQGKEGFLRAMSQPHWRTRRAAVHYLHAGWHSGSPPSALPPDDALEVARLGLVDTNRAVRMQAAIVLISGLGMPRERWVHELIPLVLPLLFDPSKKVRHYVAGFLNWRAAHVVPVETAVQAMAREEERANLPRMQRLLRAVLEAREPG
jgi:hypothetical protein